MRRETRISRSLRQLLSCHGPTAYGSGVTGCARTRAPAEERRAAVGAAQATEPGCGAEPDVSQGISATVTEWLCSLTTRRVRLSGAILTSTGPLSTGMVSACSELR